MFLLIRSATGYSRAFDPSVLGGAAVTIGLIVLDIDGSVKRRHQFRSVLAKIHISRVMNHDLC